MRHDPISRVNMAQLIASAVAAVLSAPTLASANPPAPAPSFEAEKCYGINLRGRNDCAAPGAHSCAGESQISNDPKSWVYVPVGTCTKIAGGSTKPKG
jgi:uncharacterized membrane protein